MSQISRMLVPTDFSPPSALAADYAIDMARRYGATIELLHVIEDFAGAHFTMEGYIDLPHVRDRIRAEAETGLAELARRAEAAGVRVSTHLMSGNPAAAIVKHANGEASDLIVMGTHGRSGFAHLLLGSVAERVVRTAPCPVLTVRDTRRTTETVAADMERLQQPAAIASR